MKSSNKRKGGKCQVILRKSSQWCNWDEEEEWGRRKKKWKRRKKEKKAWVEIQEKEEQPIVDLNEAKLMNEEDWFETTKMRKNLRKLMEKFAK